MPLTTDVSAASILLVEDEAIIALAQQKNLLQAGYRVQTVYTGEAAVDAVKQQPDIELILMDVDLGRGIDGIEATRQILETRELPVVFVTSHSEPSYVERVEAVTRYGYVLKGAGQFTLFQAIKTALRLFAVHITLKKSELRFRTLFESIPAVAVQGFGPDGTVNFWNRASELLYGHTAAEAIGSNLLDLIIPLPMRDAVSREILSSAQTGTPIPPAELELQRKDGSSVTVYSSHAALHYPDGETDLFCMDVDISERRRMEQEYRSLIEQQSELFVRVSVDGVFEFVSDSYCALFGKTREELVGNSFMPLVHPEDQETTRLAMAELLVPPYRCRVEQRAWTVDGWRWLEWDDSAIVNDAGEITAILGAGRDVTDRKSAEEEQRQMLNSLPIPVVVSEGADERVLLVNDAFRRLFGYTEKDLPDAACWFKLAYPDAEYRRVVSRQWAEAIARAEETGSAVGPVTADATGADGEVHTVTVRGHVVGRLKLIVFTDLTEINAVQRRLERSIAEKDHLMRELNHRVKNNLTLISSLVSMKEAELQGAVDLSDVRGQLGAIGLVHEKLCSTGQTGRINLKMYLDDLLPSFLSFYSGGVVAVENTGADIELSPSATVLIGVLVNELATNAIKHGFDQTVPPRFTVTMARTDDGPGPAVILAVSNNGRPFPDDKSMDSPKTLGLRLISALTEQLKGVVELIRSPETTFRFTIPLL